MAAGATEAAEATFDFADRLLDCVGAALAATPAGAPARQLVATGAVLAWDDCECGQLSVHVLRHYPSDTFPILKQAGPYDRCEARFTVVEYVITILRCVPVQHDNGDPPTAAAMTEAARRDFRDRRTVRRGAMCCVTSTWPNPASRPLHLLGEQLAVGDEGMCAGSELHMFVAFSNCSPCADGT